MLIRYPWQIPCSLVKIPREVERNSLLRYHCPRQTSNGTNMLSAISRRRFKNSLLAGNVARARMARATSQPIGRTVMAFEVRRIVTGHDANGKAIVASDERLGGGVSPPRPGVSGRVEIWSADKMPVDNSEGAA